MVDPLAHHCGAREVENPRYRPFIGRRTGISLISACRSASNENPTATPTFPGSTNMVRPIAYQCGAREVDNPRWQLYIKSETENPNISTEKPDSNDILMGYCVNLSSVFHCCLW